MHVPHHVGSVQTYVQPFVAKGGCGAVAPVHSNATFAFARTFYCKVGRQLPDRDSSLQRGWVCRSAAIVSEEHGWEHSGRTSSVSIREVEEVFAVVRNQDSCCA